MTFEDIIHHLVSDLGPMDIPEEEKPHDVLCTVYTYSTGYFQFTAETRDTAGFVEYLYRVLRHTDIVSVQDIHGVHHVLRVEDVAHIQVEEESDESGGEAEGSHQADRGEPPGDDGAPDS